MKVVTYLAFTFLSLLIQFCVMDYIQEKIQIGEDDVYLNATSQKESFSYLLKNISSKPHALYYRTSRALKTNAPLTIYSNSSMTEVSLGTTDVTTTIFDVLYDENTSDTEAPSPTTETYFTSTEFENITEITFFETKNKSSNVPNTSPKISYNMNCDCNILYKVCDINCCCDQDCTDPEHKIFECQGTGKIANQKTVDGCISHIFDQHRYGSSMLDNLFCVVKTNLPNKRSIKKYNEASIGQYYKWRSGAEKQYLYEFKKALYKQADPIWILKNGIIYYLDFPAPMINNYCSNRVPIRFLKVEKIICNLKFKDLEMFNILNSSEEVMVISATTSTVNSSALNCSNLHCINWTILACDDGSCVNYNKSLNEALCTDTICSNIALKIDYDFYYYDMKIINATIKLHLQNVSYDLPFMSQEVNVRFHMTNQSIDHVIELSGNPGYSSGLPVIVSYVKNNHTENFYNATSERRSRMLFPENRNGMCISSNTSNNFVKFGINKRTKCRYDFEHNILTKKNNMCNSIQNDINELLRLNSNLSISPFGNPLDISDDNWINLHIGVNKREPVYGEFNDNTLKLSCYNLINRVSLTVLFANVNEKSFIEQNKILSAKYELTTKNLSFYVDDISIVITIDINFVDLTKPSIVEYAGSPHLNIHLPKDFFFPFPQNSCSDMSTTCILTIYCCVMLFFANKMTLE